VRTARAASARACITERYVRRVTRPRTAGRVAARWPPGAEWPSGRWPRRRRAAAV